MASHINTLSHTNHDLFTCDNVHKGDTFHREINNALFSLSHTPSSMYVGFTTRDLWFSIYLNHYYKINFNENMSWRDELKVAKCTVEYIQSYPILNMDINYSDVYYCNIPAFSSSLYKVLDRNNIVYTKNEHLIYDSVSKYRSSIIDVNLHYDNYNSIPWIAWVLMLSNKFTDMSVDRNSLEHIKNVVSEYNNKVKRDMSKTYKSLKI